MITLTDATLDRLGRLVLLANTPTFLWRKLAEQPQVQDMSTGNSAHALQEALTSILQRADLEANDITLAYCLLVAWLFQGPEMIGLAEETPDLDRLPLARGIVASRPHSRTTASSGRTVSALITSSGATSTRRVDS